MIIKFVKFLCLAAYALALGHLAGLLPQDSFSLAPLIAVLLLVMHSVELLLMFKHVRLYRGPVAVSILLTLLFGVLHWMPLARKARKAE